MKHTASRAARRYVFPIIILIVAFGLFYINQRREAAEAREIRVLLIDLCEAARGDELSTDRMPAVDPLLGPTLVEAFHEACDVEGDIDVAVAGGEPSHRSDGPASHHAIIRIAGAERLGLRLATPDDRIVILGYWRPGETETPAAQPDGGESS